MVSVSSGYMDGKCVWGRHDLVIVSVGGMAGKSLNGRHGW